MSTRPAHMSTRPAHMSITTALLTADEEEEYKEISIDDIVLKNLPRTPGLWDGQGSELELEEEILVENRPLISFMVSRKRKFFGKLYFYLNPVKAEAHTWTCSSDEDIAIVVY